MDSLVNAIINEVLVYTGSDIVADDSRDKIRENIKLRIKTYIVQSLGLED